MTTARCAHLVAKGLSPGTDEMWIARQPVLLMAYLSAYLPWTGRQIMTKVVGPSRVAALKSGSDPYDALVRLSYSWFILLCIYVSVL